MLITLKDGSNVEYQESRSAYEIAQDISQGLARVALAAKIDGELVDLDTIIDKDCTLEIVTFRDEEGKKVYRHTCSHVLAQAVKSVFPTVKLAIGPAIANGFYYDLDFTTPITFDDLARIEDEMKKIIIVGVQLAGSPVLQLRVALQQVLHPAVNSIIVGLHVAHQLNYTAVDLRQQEAEEQVEKGSHQYPGQQNTDRPSPWSRKALPLPKAALGIGEELVLKIIDHRGE